MSFQQHELAEASQRPAAREAAAAFVERCFPDCLVAMLTGSVVHGTATERSDLDIVVITRRDEGLRSATFHEMGWPIEVFIHTPDSYPAAFAADAKRRWPLLPLLCRDGVVLRDHGGLAERIKEEAQAILDQGPAPLSEGEIGERRFMLTWMLEDLEAVEDLLETFLMAGIVAHCTTLFLLEYHRRWLGQGKWLPRELRRFDPVRGRQLTEAIEALVRTGDRGPLIRFGDTALQLVGGRRFEGHAERAPAGDG